METIGKHIIEWDRRSTVVGPTGKKGQVRLFSLHVEGGFVYLKQRWLSSVHVALNDFARFATTCAWFVNHLHHDSWPWLESGMCQSTYYFSNIYLKKKKKKKDYFSNTRRLYGHRCNLICFSLIILVYYS